jgi:hypothetical protein
LEIWMPEVGKGETGNVIGALESLDRFPTRDPVLLTACLSDNPAATLTRLRFSNAEIERGRRLAAFRNGPANPDDPAAVRRWMAAAGPAVNDVLTVLTAEGGDDGLGARVEEIRRNGAPLSVAELSVSGEDVIAAGAPKGPAVGYVLRALLDEVLEDPSRNTPTYLAARIPFHVSRFPARESGKGGRT